MIPVTAEVVEAAYEIVDGWYQEGKIDWAEVWDRLDGMKLKDDTVLDLGNDLTAPELIEIRRRVLRMRREAQ